MADIDLTIESQATAPVEMEVSAGQVMPAPVDDTLTIRGMAADAKATGDLIRQNTADIAALQEAVEELDPGGGSAHYGIQRNSVRCAACRRKPMESPAAGGELGWSKKMLCVCADLCSGDSRPPKG